MPGPGPTSAQSHPSDSAPACSAPSTVIASSGPPKHGPAVTWSDERVALDQLRDGVRERPGQRAAGDLDVTATRAGPALAERERSRRELSVQRQHCDRHAERPPHVLEAFLDGLDRVLERRVVQLHHVRARPSPPSRQPAEVRVDDVEPAATEAEVLRLDVDHHLVARLDLPGQPG